MSIHPIFSVLVSRPELVMEHMAGYAALVQEEASSAGSALARRALAWAAVALSFTVFVTLAGVAAMLGAMQGEFHWMLLAAPAAALLMCGLAWSVARQPLPGAAFSDLKTQFDADAAALRVATAGTR